jgi:hypothetical protein
MHKAQISVEALHVIGAAPAHAAQIVHLFPHVMTALPRAAVTVKQKQINEPKWA